MDAAAGEIERIARLSYGRLVSILAAASDLASAEDALGDVLAKALAAWPDTGIPANPEAWLLTAARNRIADGRRHAAVATRQASLVSRLIEESFGTGQADFPDKRLELMFVCAHPAIDERSRTPLMLQCVLGLDAERMASVFLVPAKTLGQRLVRAKAKIRDSAIRWSLPEGADLEERTGCVLDAVYAAYTVGDDGRGLGDAKASSLSGEALWLAGLVVQLLPSNAEAQGLMALILFNEARAQARRSPAGEFVALGAQDVTLWNDRFLSDAETCLRNAARLGAIGRYQIEAAIQAVHCNRKRTGITDWPALRTLHDALAQLSPTLGALTGQAAAIAEVSGPGAGLQALMSIAAARREDYQPWWAVRAHLEAASGNWAGAYESYSRAAALTEDAAVRSYLIKLRDQTSGS